MCELLNHCVVEAAPQKLKKKEAAAGGGGGSGGGGGVWDTCLFSGFEIPCTHPRLLK